MREMEVINPTEKFTYFLSIAIFKKSPKSKKVSDSELFAFFQTQQV